jgi:acyl-CoA synthetase (AMP-forming)/AMP-acid ligase II
MISSSSTPPKLLSYQEVCTSIQRHEQWLDRILRQTFHVNDDKRSDDQIIVAYLSSNSIDFWLSLLACTSDSIKGLVALLNTRWTPLEMAQALEVEEGTSKTASARAKTLILYGSGFKLIAEQVVVLLGHVSCCLPIPTIAEILMIEQKPPADKTMKQSASTFEANRIRQPENPLHMDLSTLMLWAQNSDTKGNKVWNSVDDGTLAAESMTKNILTTNKDVDAMIVFTSGTTSKAKGVRLGHKALILQALAKRDPPCNYSTESVVLASNVPLFHVGGISSCLATLLVGGTLVFPVQVSSSSSSSSPSAGGFDVSIVQAALSHPIWPSNTLVVVPAMLVTFFAFLEQQHHQQQQQQHSPNRSIFPDVRLLLIGGQSASEKTLWLISQTFPNARVVQTYACTEAASSLTFWNVPIPTTTTTTSTSVHKSTQRSMDTPMGNCVGTPPAHIQVRLVLQEKKEEDGIETITNQPQFITAPNQPGVIVTKGPHVMNGYWKRGIAAVPAAKDLSGGSNYKDWFQTNDLGYWDSKGQLYFCGRVNDVIRTGGETVLAQQVERVLLLHPQVLECAVFAQPDERFGEAVACALLLTKPTTTTTTKQTLPVPLSSSSLSSSLLLGETVKQWCQDHGLANYKRPRYIFVVDELPKNASGKVLKHKLAGLQHGRSQPLMSKL